MNQAGKLFIIAGTHDEFRNWRKNYVNLIGDSFILSQQDLVYVHDVSYLKGVRNPEGRFIGTWWKRNDINEIMFQLLISGVDSKIIDQVAVTKDKLNGVEMDLSLYGL